MRYKILLSIALVTAILAPNAIRAQEEKISEKYTAYELMSKYYNENFRPFKKKNIYVGLAFSLEDVQQSNTSGLFQDVIDGQSLDYSILLKTGYYIGNYAMVGMYFNYAQGNFDGQVFRDPDTLQTNSITRVYDFTPVFRSAIPLTKNERLSFFVDIGFTLGYETSLVRNTKNFDEIDKTYSEGFHFRAGISPGVTFFAIESFAFEVALNVLGYDLLIKEQTVNDESQSRIVEQKIDANIDLLSLQLGLAYNFGSKK